MSSDLSVNGPWRMKIAMPPRGDIALAIGLFILDTVVFSDILARSGEVGSAIAIVVFAMPAYVALAWRRSAPVIVFLVIWTHALIAALSGIHYSPTLDLLVALYTVSATKRWRTSVFALVVTFAVMAPFVAIREVAQNPEDPAVSTAVYVSLFYGIVTSGAWGLGLWARRSRHRIQTLDRRRRAEAAEAVRTERGRIARELHDILSHSVSVMVLQAAGARRVMATDPARTDEALAHIEAVGKESMGDLRRLLGVLDESGAVGPALGEPGPQPGLAEVPALLNSMRMSGLDVTLQINGDPGQLDASINLSAYRIVQEALTNCIKHAGRDVMAAVTLTWSPHSLMVEIVDDGGKAVARSSALSTAHGLPGLRERARAVGGHLEAGPDPGGGFRVSATLPIAAPSSTEVARSTTP